MTVASTTRKAGPYTGNGVATSFAFAFKVFTTADISVVKADSAGTESTLVLDSDYSVTLNADQTANPGGSITYPVSGSPLTAAERLAILGGVAYNQTTSLPNGGAYNASIVERALDRLTILIQQILEIANRGVRLAATAASNVSGTLPAPVPLALLGWNSTATAIQNFAGVAGVAVSTFMATVVAAVDAMTARTALGATTVGNAIFTAASAAAARSTLGVPPRATRLDVASVAGTVDLTANAPDTDDIRLTGNLAVTGVTIAVGRVVRVVCSGTPSFANNSGIVTQTGGTLQLAAGDSLVLRATAANVVEVLLLARAAGGVAAGVVVEFAGPTAPAGYLACPTSATNLSRTTYAALFAAIGTTWGAGDGSTTFGMPWYPADYASVQASSNVGTQTTGEVKAHDHNINGLKNASFSGGSSHWNLYNGTDAPNTGFLTSTGGTANLPAGVRMLKCVKY